MTDNLRPYQDAALPDLLALHHAVSQAAGSDRRVTAADIEEQILAPGFDRARQLAVAEVTDQPHHLLAQCGFRVIWTHTEPYPQLESTLILHPEARQSGLGERMIRNVWQKGVPFVRQLGASRAILQARCTEADADFQAIYKNLGLKLVRDNYTMVHANLDSVTPAPLPSGVELRAYRQGPDDLGWWQAWTDAFEEHWGQIWIEREDWAWLTRLASFFPELSLVAATGDHLDEIVGFCHCRMDGRPGAPTGRKSGMLRWVGVRRAWRRRGLGDALTRAGLIALREAGVEKVYLGVDNGSWTGADRLYQRNGFTIAQRNLFYRRECSVDEMASSGMSGSVESGE